MDANTVPTLGRQLFQQKLQRLLILWTFSIWPMLLEGKRLIEDVYDVLQICKDQPDRWALVVGFVRDTHKIVETNNFLREFFTKHVNLWSSPEFLKLVLAPALVMDETTSVGIGRVLNLKENMFDADIRKELGENHVFENTRAFCNYLKEVFEHQWNGAGELVSDGSANIFYVQGLGGDVFAVDIRPLDNANLKWAIWTYQLDDDLWGFGGRAFSANTTHSSEVV